MDDRWGPFPGAYIRKYCTPQQQALERIDHSASSSSYTGYRYPNSSYRRQRYDEYPYDAPYLQPFPDICSTSLNWPFSVDDRAITRICIETAHPSFYGLDVAILPYMYALPYTYMYASCCYVLSLLPPSGTSMSDFSSSPHNVVGYIVATPNTKHFLTLWKAYYYPRLQKMKGYGNFSDADDVTDYLLRDERMLNPEILMWNDPRVNEKWPAHIHINITEEWRGRRWGKEMVKVACQRLVEKGAKGVHLGVAPDNEGARRFYARCGFREEEVGPDCVWMVKDLIDENGDEVGKTPEGAGGKTLEPGESEKTAEGETAERTRDKGKQVCTKEEEPLENQTTKETEKLKEAVDRMTIQEEGKTMKDDVEKETRQKNTGSSNDDSEEDDWEKIDFPTDAVADGATNL